MSVSYHSLASLIVNVNRTNSPESATRASILTVRHASAAVNSAAISALIVVVVVLFVVFVFASLRAGADARRAAFHWTQFEQDSVGAAPL